MGNTSYCNPYDYERAHGYKPGEAPDAAEPAAEQVVEQKVVTAPAADPVKPAATKVETK